jgi:hypothetical protein
MGTSGFPWVRCVSLPGLRGCCRHDPGLRDIELYQQLLGLAAPWTVTRVELSVERNLMHLGGAISYTPDTITVHLDHPAHPA